MSRKSPHWQLAWLVLAFALLACQLTSPTPASWSGTPTARARFITQTVSAATQGVMYETASAPAVSFTPTTPPPTETPQASKSETDSAPWIAFPAAESGTLRAVNSATRETIDIQLPEPVWWDDLEDGLSPDGSRLIIRAGSPYETDQFGLYEIRLPAGEIIPITPLLSLSVQRKLVNQEGTQALASLAAVSLEDALAWSPDGRFLAFTAALDNNSSDLYVLNTEQNRIDRLVGVSTHSATPFWSPGSTWLVSQELGKLTPTSPWRAESVTGLRLPGYDAQNTLYLPASGSVMETFVGWTNAHSFVSYSQTETGRQNLRQVDVETYTVRLIWSDALDLAAVDHPTGALAYAISGEAGQSKNLLGGLYLLPADNSASRLIQTGAWQTLRADRGGQFIATGMQGVLMVAPDGASLWLANEHDASLAPNGTWIVAWGDDESAAAGGARLYQSASNHPLQSLTELPVQSVIWQSDSKGFYIQSEDKLYRLLFPGLNPEVIITGIPPTMPTPLVWLQ